MVDAREIGKSEGSLLRPCVMGYTPIHATDAIQLSEQTRQWNFEFAQLKKGPFAADGGVLDLDGVSVASVALTQTLLHRGCPPPGMIAVLMAGPGSGPGFVNGQRIEHGQCVTIAGDAVEHAVSHGYYSDVVFAFHAIACGSQLDALNHGPVNVVRGATMISPGQDLIDDMVRRIEWILAAAAGQPASLTDPAVRQSLTDHVLASIVRFDASPADVDLTTRSARASRRVAVRLATDFIHNRLSEPLRLSELCRQARLKIRSLEYGFREVTGLTPIAYIRSLRLNTVRRTLLHDRSASERSISQIAMDTGFWHLSQFAVDYRTFFGETPSQTRQRALATRRAAAH